jgi:hypothetical protein
MGTYRPRKIAYLESYKGHSNAEILTSRNHSNSIESLTLPSLILEIPQNHFPKITPRMLNLYLSHNARKFQQRDLVKAYFSNTDCSPLPGTSNMFLHRHDSYYVPVPHCERTFEHRHEYQQDSSNSTTSWVLSSNSLTFSRHKKSTQPKEVYPLWCWFWDLKGR